MTKTGQDKNDGVRAIITKKAQVNLDKDFRGLVRSVKKVLNERYKKTGLDARFSASSIYRPIKESLEKYHVDRGRQYEAIVVILGYIYARRIMVDDEDKVFLDFYPEVGGNISFRFIVNPGWEQRFKTFQEKSNSNSKKHSKKNKKNSL